MKIVTILGARPQFVKAGTVSREIVRHPIIEEVIIHTGQHYDTNMSDVFFDEMRIPKPNYFLGIGGKSHGAMTGQMIEKIEEVVVKEKPDWILVYGDTNSTLAGAIVASKLRIKLAHVEAGLRSFNMGMPEEVNRILTDRVSTVLFCPTDLAVENLNREGYEHINCTIVKSGDVMQDGALYYRKLAVKPTFKIENNFVLSTIHRADNTDSLERLTSIISALNEIHKEKQVIVPLHPRTKKIIQKNGIQINFKVIDPIGYLEMIWLIDHCDIIMTDSGGLQKEAFFFKRHCITLRDDTEWGELIENKFNVLVGADKNKIIEAYNNFEFSNNFEIDLYGSGTASEKIINKIIKMSN
ncbi:MAG: UDP-N-acetylglucosamine 2-epimerase (non-hydrolyzing) [Polaribacter sp.]|nr:UDP-N-acetylglucosamine 2-epimerase (non-hydrolyzing) [Polaribacter sp.]